MHRFLTAVFALMLCASPGLAATNPPAVTADAHGFTVHGRHVILLIGTFQPSRVDPSDWDRRLAQFADSGYNTIDCLVPWNFHEPEEGHFDFSSPPHDLPRFLRLCQKHHLYVFLRSGPYVCDEWDGGGLPAWLIPKAGLEVRHDNPVFLSCVRPWVHALDQTVRPFLATNGGPIILDQLANEMDYFQFRGDAERRAYISALRDDARQDGVDVPLTACVGSPGTDDGPLRRAMGLAEGVIPTGNFYVSGAVEARARAFINAVHNAHDAGGRPMADFPVICSETGRDDFTQRRLLAGGLKGVSPFNFVSGSNFLFNNGDTNWASPIAYISTSVDYGGMLDFRGVQTPNWYAARRLAGFVNAFSDALCRAQSDTDWEGGFGVSNASLGADEGGTQGRRIYRLAVPDGPQFIFLPNEGRTAQTTTVTIGALTLPRHSTLSVPPHYDHIVPVQVPLTSWGLPGLTLRYTTGEVYGCARSGRTTTLTLTGNGGDEGEVSLSAPPPGVSMVGTPATISRDGGDWTAAYRTGATRSLSLDYGGRRLVIRIVSRQQLDAPVEAKTVSTDLLSGTGWRSADVPAPAATGQASPGPDAPTMERAGVMRGAAWYQTDFVAHPAAVASPTLSLEHAGDIVTVYLNGRCLGTQLGQGNALSFDTAGALHDGENALAVRTEVWGHSNFDDGRNPSLHLDSPRGFWGALRVGDASPVLTGGWKVTAEEPQPPTVTGVEGPFITGETGQRRWWSRTIPRSGAVSPSGYVLHITGRNVLGHLFVNGHGAGRCLFGPAGDPHLTGGPSDQFYVPAAWLHRGGPANALSLFLLATGPDPAITAIDWTPVPQER